MTREPTINEYAEAIGALTIIQNLVPYDESGLVREASHWFDETVTQSGYQDERLTKIARRLIAETGLMTSHKMGDSFRYRLSRFIQAELGVLKTTASRALRDIMEEE